MQRSLANPPLFAVTREARGHITLSEALGAAVHIFVLEDDIVCVAVLPDGVSDVVVDGRRWVTLALRRRSF